MKLQLTEQKLRGGYYTPKPIAHFLCKWAIRKSTQSILEPSCGDGNILLEAANRAKQLPKSKITDSKLLTGIELNEEEAKTCLQRLKREGISISQKNLLIGDFFKICQEMQAKAIRFDAVIGNPPFVRYQNFPEEQRKIAIKILENAGLKTNRLLNTWVAFLVGSTKLLSNHGRLAMVIPAELLQVNYAAETRRFLSANFSRITLVTFRQLVFSGLQQEVVLFLGEKNGVEKVGIRTIEFDGMDDLLNYDDTEFNSNDLKPLDHSTDKWTQYFLTTEEITLLREFRKNVWLKKVSDIASVDVGIVTGMNDFFVLNQEKVDELSAEHFTLPLVARSPHLSGIVYSNSERETQVQNNLRVFLLNLPNVSRERFSSNVKNYILDAEKKGLNKGYKCRIRNPWYVVPSVWKADAFMLRQIHHYPKVIINKADATCTDTIHRLRFLNGTKREAFAAAFLNSATFAYSEVMGRSYGGGVLELEPKEAEALPVTIRGAWRLDFEKINNLVSKGNIDSVLELTDSILLKDGLGLSKKEIKILNNIWLKLRNRRNGRR